MADIEYSIKSTLPIEVHVGASEASATICWLGAVKDNTNCIKCDEEKIYCENVYIGANDCVDGKSSARTISGTVVWNPSPSYSATIDYVIYQEAAICDTCGSAITECEILNYWVSPYIITPSTSSTTLYWEYWLTNRYENDDCDITREKKLASVTSAITTSIPCDQRDREFPISATTECGEPVAAKYYIQKPDVCCDLSGDCYEINEIVYNPTSVSSEGGLVDFSFDYKRIEIDENCEPKETYGTYFGKWQVPPCKGDDCCYSKMVQSAFTWFDICGRGDVSGCEITSLSEYNDGDLVYIPSSGTSVSFSSNTLNDKNTIYLSILRDKSISADCEIHCDFDTVYCVNKDTIKKEYYDYDTGKWSGFTSDEYIYPYYGGRIRVSWEYYIITIYEDCTVGVSVGNKHSDLLTIPEYDDCNDHEDFDDFHINIDYNGSSSSCNIIASSSGDIPPSGGDVKYSIDEKDCPNSITVTPQGNCYGKTTNSSKNNTRGEGSEGGEPSEDFIMNEIPYEFKKGLCDLLPSQLEYVKRSLPDYLQNVCDEEEKCNEFTVTCYQYKKECDPDCVPCLDNYMIDNVVSGGSATTRYFRSSCVVKEIVYGDGEMIGSTFKNDCSDWVKATVNGSTVTFKIDANIIDGKTGPYRRGKVIFIHDNNCKEEVIINQHGTSDNEDYEPDPGYECDLAINDITICLGESGTITPSGGESKECKLTLTLSDTTLCVDDENASIKITVGGSETCDETKIDFVANKSPITVSGCGGKRLIGYYKYNCSNFDKNLLSYNIDDSDWSMVLDAPTDKKGNVYVVTDDNNSGREKRVGFSLDYNGNDVAGWITIIQSSDISDCGDYGEGFEALLDEFNSVLRSNNLTEVEHGTDLYTYLGESYQTAEKAYNGESDSYSLFRLFYENTYDKVFDDNNTTFNNYFVNEHKSQWGTDNTYEDGTVLSATTAWLMAMQLSEIYNNTGTSTNYQTKLFKKGYEIGGGRYVPIYGKFNNSTRQYNGYTVKGDVNIGRLAASAIYAIIRSEYSFADIDGFRSEVGMSPIDRSTSWTDLSVDINTNCTNIWDSNNVIGYSVNLSEIFPSAAGPFATNYYFDDSHYCGTAPTRNYPQEQIRDVSADELFVPESKNYIFDEIVDAYVTTKYNLDISDVNIARTVQAIADAEDDVIHMLANKTYYKYTLNNPKGHFSPGSPSDYNGTFDGVFSKSVIGKDLSSKIAVDMLTETELSEFFGGIAYMGSKERNSILLVQWGRRRPGQGERDYIVITGQTGGNAMYNGQK